MDSQEYSSFCFQPFLFLLPGDTSFLSFFAPNISLQTHLTVLLSYRRQSKPIVTSAGVNSASAASISVSAAADSGALV